MTVVADRIARLRALMAEKGIDAYVVPTADFHQSEYVGEHFKARKFITGFSGSYGTAVIGKDDAGLWTDGRYFFQAEHEMEGSITQKISLIRSGKTARHFLTNRHFSWKKSTVEKALHPN